MASVFLQKNVFWNSLESGMVSVDRFFYLITFPTESTQFLLSYKALMKMAEYVKNKELRK